MTRKPLCLALAIAVTAPGVALADPAPGDSPVAAAPAGPAKPTKVKATAVALPHPGVPETDMVAIMRAVENGMRRNPRVDLKDLDSRLVEFSQEAPGDKIDAARQAAKDGEQALADGRYPDAQEKLKQAITGLTEVLAYVKKQELADAMASLAVAEAAGGDNRTGRQTFVRLLTWRPDYQYDVTRLPPRYLGLYEAAQRDVDRLKKGRLEITSKPPGAQAYIDGKYVGLTPATTEELPAGEHFVTVKMDGYKKDSRGLTVVAKQTTPEEIDLSKSEKYLLIEEAVNALDPKMGAEVPDSEIDNFQAVLFVDQVAFVRARPEQNGAFPVEAYLYDLRTHRLVSKVKQTVPRAGIDAAGAQIASALYVNVNYEGKLVEKKDVVPVAKAPTPIYKRWWFWTGIGAVVVGAAAAGAAIAATRPASCPDGDLCPTIRY